MNKFIDILSDKVVIKKNKISINAESLDLNPNKIYEIIFSSGSILDPNKNAIDTNLLKYSLSFKEGEEVVTGTILKYAGNDIPNGYLLCDGSAVSRTTYSKLFTTIGTTYGEGDGSTTFNIPDLMDKVILGDSTPGITESIELPVLDDVEEETSETGGTGGTGGSSESGGTGGTGEIIESVTVKYIIKY